MDLSKVTAITIPEGVVAKIEASSRVLWELGEKLKGNLVPTAIDANGSILNGVGYVNNSRVSSSGEIKTQTGTPLTGYIDCEGINDASVVRTKGVQFDSALYCGVVFYDANFNLLQGIRFPSGTTLASGLSAIVYASVAGTKSTERADGVTEITFNFRETELETYPPKYFRLFAKGNGADMIVTINEEIE